MIRSNMNVLLKSIRAFKFNPWSVGRTNTFTTSCRLNVKVAVCGSSGGVGQPLTLLLKLSPHITELSLYDIHLCEGMAVDLSHVNTKPKLSYYTKDSVLPDAIDKKDIIVILAGKARDPGMTRADLFSHNASIVREITYAMSKVAPSAALCIVTNPINGLIAVAAEVLKKAKVFDPRKLFGVTTLDCVRASTFAAELMCYDPVKLVIPVIGGHSGTTIVPVLSQSSSPIKLPKDKVKMLIEKIQNAGTEVVDAKKGKGSATVSTAYAVARFVFALCRAIKGEKNIVECAMVHSDLTDAEYFATPLLLGPMGVKKNLGYGRLTKDECCLVITAVKALVKEIEEAKKFLENESKEKKK